MENFRSNISWCTTTIENEFSWTAKFGQTKIGDLDRESVILPRLNQDVLRLEITMDNTALVEVTDAHDELAHDLDHISLRNHILLQVGL